MTRETEYKNICDKLTCTPCPDSKLRQIKQHFLREIDSPRRFDRINNITFLIRILERRDCLNTEHIDPLRYIAVELQRNDIIALIDAYLAGPQVFVDEPLNWNGNREEEEVMRVIPPIDNDPIERVYKLICTKIGKKWKDLARKLKVPEGSIDELELRYHLRISDIVREVLRFHRENSDPRYWKINLCKGLSDARRKDLAFEVQQIFAMYNLM